MIVNHIDFIKLNTEIKYHIVLTMSTGVTCSLNFDNNYLYMDPKNYIGFESIISALFPIRSKISFDYLLDNELIIPYKNTYKLTKTAMLKFI